MKTCPQCSTGYPDSHTTCPTHGVPLNEIRDLKPGMVIHHSYRIVRKLGQGGMGAVYLAQHTLMDEPRALKFLSAELSSDQAFTARFLREVRTLRQIRNRNVVDCGDLERAEDDSLFFSMEFVDGPDLRRFLRDAPQPIDVPLALSIARNIAQGLAAAHARGMVHRDIKPENILMAREAGAWLPKIADFGIVATKESSTAFTRTGGTLLTVTYAAPEQWRGTPAADLDGRTDLYALGGLLYEMLTGQTVFHALNYEGWAWQHQNTPPPPPSTLRPDLANWQGLDALVLRLLAKDREDRPKDVDELLSLTDAVRYVPPEERRKTVIENSGKQVDGKRSRRVPIWVWAASVFVLLATAFVAVWIFRPKPPSNAPVDYQALAKKYGGTLTPPKGIAQTNPSNVPNEVRGLPPGAIMEPIRPSIQSQDIAEIEKHADALAKQNRFSEAFPLYEQTCAGGRAGSCNHLGAIYLFGTAGTRDDLLAAAFFKKACDADYALGCANLAEMYQRGEGLPMDTAKAAELYSKACEGGRVDGCDSLGMMYRDGDGVIMDESRAVTLFLKSCNAGDAGGCDLLANCYESGEGVGVDKREALRLHNKACSMGSKASCGLEGNLH